MATVIVLIKHTLTLNQNQRLWQESQEMNTLGDKQKMDVFLTLLESLCSSHQYTVMETLNLSHTEMIRYQVSPFGRFSWGLIYSGVENQVHSLSCYTMNKVPNPSIRKDGSQISNSNDYLAFSKCKQPRIYVFSPNSFISQQGVSLISDNERPPH